VGTIEQDGRGSLQFQTLRASVDLPLLGNIGSFVMRTLPLAGGNIK